MTRNDQLSRLLPQRFANGTQIRRFAKPCPRCGGTVEARDMEGQMMMLDQKLFLAAHAACPHCDHRFGVACAITADKRVHRVRLPMWLYKLWMKSNARRGVTIVPADPQWQGEEDDAPPPVPSIADAELSFDDAIVGRFQGEAIPEACEWQGRRYRFERVVQPGLPAQCAAHEILVRAHLVYALEDAPQPA
ncbi:hypothetical protein EV683_1264 [Crenobacter luteus]|uniref:Uncharacterized protein n=1 Tax=Crenobacter luteus TaxID=1452487 RepID=A0A165F8E6_9NEIS|nr:hypothetical protein [Crenobacter luteus]KZE32452.1 hypothetical protein AVW16_11665 [Crenobacter luteus]TCP10244.1 hypothetical protein EV683_1264 [Crenobacter luteus]